MMMMKGENKVVEDVEEGEISDNASVEEISEADFNKQEVNKEDECSLSSTSNLNSIANPNSKSKPEMTTTTSTTRVWTYQDLYKYQIKKGYTAGLHNLAWAQAVQKKPLSEVLNLDFEDENNNSNNNSSRAAAASPSLCSSNNSKEENKVVDAVVIDDDDDDNGGGGGGDAGDAGEKEEGELEEGEIDLYDVDSNAVQTLDQCEVKDDNFKVEFMDVDDKKISLHDGEVEKQVELIREALEKIIQNISMISFEGACSQLLNSLDLIKEVELVDDFLRKKDGVMQLLFSTIQALYSDYFSMNSIHRERNKGFFSRVLTSVKSMDESLFSTDQMKEIEEMVQSLDSQTFILDLRTNHDKETSVGVSGHNMKSSHDLARDPVETLKQTPYGTKSRGILLPLLDLHKDHDEDDLPSPTRDAPRLSFPQTLGISDGSFKPDMGSGRLSHGMEGIRLHPYETDAVRAVSNYQQKFGRSMLSNDLPSPTPSEEHDGGVDDNGDEVSSSLKGKSVTMNLPSLVQPNLPLPLPQIENANVQNVIAPASVLPPLLVSNLPAKPSAKSRDPRLRFTSPDAGNSDNSQRSAVVNNDSKAEAASLLGTKMQRNVEETAIDGPAVKRPRSGLENPGTEKDVRATSGTGGWLGETGTAGSQNTNRTHLQENLRDPRKRDNEVASKVPNLAMSENDAALLSSLVSAASPPALLKNIAVNPTMLMSFLKLGQQQKLVPEALQNHVDASKNASNSANGSSILGAASVVSVDPAVAPGLLPKPAVPNQVPAQTVQDEAGIIRMKPRDPRRILHSNPPPRSGSLGSEQLKNGSLTDIVPDIGQQFSKNLKDVADIVSASRASTAPVVVSQNLPSQSTQVSPVEAKAIVSSTSDQQTVSASTVEAAAAGLSHSQNSWGDVEHLFEGYDDQQRAAIQRERSRRIEEQKKMFAQRKLSLVLDLDHTLLNSAKFVEVDLVHEEILRKKEQEDKEKSQRHLFRFSHMGMWTKLRPGIWNFLEKASKLYELHLYTMGNKLYATEMAKVLDPKGTLFAGRVISRGDDGDPLDGDDRFKTKDLEGVLGMESGVVIIDDSVRVWPHNKLNLIVVERYTYFPCSRRQFGLLGPSLLEIDHDERPEEGTLASSLAVIEKIHQNFFSHQSLDDVDVRNILAMEQRKILAGCRIVFSRVFPVGEANPHLHPLWQTAGQFGAVCTNQIDEQVTHVVANSLGTDKVNWALSTGRFVVHPGWVEASALLYRRANEQDFAIKA